MADRCSCYPCFSLSRHRTLPPTVPVLSPHCQNLLVRIIQVLPDIHAQLYHDAEVGLRRSSHCFETGNDLDFERVRRRVLTKPDWCLKHRIDQGIVLIVPTLVYCQIAIVSLPGSLTGEVVHSAVLDATPSFVNEIDQAQEVGL